MSGLVVRRHGDAGPLVIVLHGGPAAAGEAAPLARGLADGFRVLEPWQRGSGGEPLTVARHVADLHDIVRECGVGARPALVGESWGAMLALAYAAEHPDRAGPLALVGCGTFDPAARARMREILDKRQDDDLRRRLEALRPESGDPARLREMYGLMAPLYDYDAEPAAPDPETPDIDLRAHAETWNDMLRLQVADIYPAAFAAIRGPVLMLHGSHDPHPGRMIRDGLAPHLPQLEYQELDRCGHSPWRERQAQGAFFAVLRGWLARHMSGDD
ncbi:MAG: alpha/beta hydrolase [Candidatus Krumholzibacteriota bacterium]|nr:alpha/beta hydrolase [Candidatus Krumholzibacteriota bacterium]